MEVYKKMSKTLGIALIWCLINFPITFIAYKIDKSFFFSMFFLIGYLIIICFMFYEKKQEAWFKCF